MKNQYFADRRDFSKYDLLLQLMASGLGFEQLVLIWMLTRDDGSADGEIRDYSVGQRRQALHDWLQTQHRREHRDVVRLADCPGFADAEWRLMPVLDVVPDDPGARAEYIARAAALTAKPSLVFLDPDNGMMVGSATAATRCKYVDYGELATLSGAMHDDSALLVYQHLPRVKREVFYAEALRRLRQEAGAVHATWLSPDSLVAYFLIAKSDERLRQVAKALEPYLTLNRFHFPQGGSA
jgi:hypothetical protein